MVFHWSLSDNKPPQVFKTLFSILAVLNSVVAWMVSTHPLISKSSSPFNNPLLTVLKAPITIGIISTFLFHSFFKSLARSRFLSFFSLLLCSQPVQHNPQFCKFSFFCLLIIIRSGLRAEIIIIIIIIIYSFRVFPSVLADGFSLEFE